MATTPRSTAKNPETPATDASQYPKPFQPDAWTPAQQRIIEKALALLESRLINSDALTSPVRVRQYCQLQLGHERDEHFACLFLTAQHHAISFEIQFRGSIDGAAVYPRVIVRRCLELNAAAVILVHNHPSGVSEPSPADRQITVRLQRALELIDVRVVDHLIVSAGDATSFAQAGLL
ncbi:DNA repair protein RadC [gamma proteobacterium NOR5-3]|nr:DNA repair protein RadC [gamma proteobacterium NOR5-3]